ncbi:Uncharacterised protein [Chlamydia trachomatis]|nr:Uncharacterised protein [Chlamydia trachomatis]
MDLKKFIFSILIACVISDKTSFVKPFLFFAKLDFSSLLFNSNLSIVLSKISCFSFKVNGVRFQITVDGELNNTFAHPSLIWNVLKSLTV